MIASIVLFFGSLIAIAVLLGRHIARVRRMEIELDVLRRRNNRDINRTYLVSIQKFTRHTLEVIKKEAMDRITTWVKNILRFVFGYARKKTVRLRNYIGHTHIQETQNNTASVFLENIQPQKEETASEKTVDNETKNNTI